MDNPVWKFETERFTVALSIEMLDGYRYDGDDPDGETQRLLDEGAYVAFDSKVSVSLDGVEIAADYLGGSVYSVDDVEHFWTAHRDPNPMNRNCSIMRAARGANVSICHYFPDMVRTAIAQARAHLVAIPHVNKRG